MRNAGPFNLDFARRFVDRRVKRQVVEAYLGPTRLAAREWISSTGRPDNFYYGLDSRNALHLVSFISVLFDVPPGKVEQLASELSESPAISEAAAQLSVNPQELYGRRLGWYLVARLTKPRFIVETGVHDGIGAVVLTEALRRNTAEGRGGKYRGTDIDPRAGWLLEPQGVDAEVLIGDSITSLEKLDSGQVDLFINDSDHSEDYEYREYVVMTDRMSPQGIMLGDNAHATDALLRYSRDMGRSFIFFQEKPANHWYPGAGIGFSFPHGTQSSQSA